MEKKFLKLGTLALLVSSAVFFSACSTSTQSEEGEEESTEMSEEEAEGEEAEEVEAPASPRMETMDEMGTTSVTLNWGSPGVKDRAIWGELVPWGEVWRAGANETSKVTFGSDVVIGETTVEAGTYGLLIIPQEEGDWTVIVTTQYDRDEHGIWGSMGYDETTDVVRVDVTPTWADESEERLKWGSEEGAITFAWEKARLSIPFSPAE